ncbi:potassium transporter TrkA [Nitriliruptoria bacterium AS10]|nr:potassium transporter TrkA [Salsipaludibacter albus]
MRTVMYFLTAVALSMVVTRTATVALTMTGLSRQAARFQARSAFSGAGFTTGEAEWVVNHPVRRRIVMLLILLGGAGLVTSLATLVVSLSRLEQGAAGAVPVALVGGVAALWAIGGSRVVDRWVSRLIEWLLDRFTELEVRDYEHLLHLSDDWKVGELHIEEGDWIVGVPLEDLDLPEEGVVVLGVQRADGRYVGAPRPSTRLHPGDTVLLYGQDRTIDELDRRQAGASGDDAHDASQARHDTLVEEQQQGERAAGET